MVDRLSDLKGELPAEDQKLEDDEGEDAQPGKKGSDDVTNEEFMKEFFEEVNAIKAGMAQIRRNIR